MKVTVDLIFLGLKTLPNKNNPDKPYYQANFVDNDEVLKVFLQKPETQLSMYQGISQYAKVLVDLSIKFSGSKTYLDVLTITSEGGKN